MVCYKVLETIRVQSRVSCRHGCSCSAACIGCAPACHKDAVTAHHRHHCNSIIHAAARHSRQQDGGQGRVQGKPRHLSTNAGELAVCILHMWVSEIKCRSIRSSNKGHVTSYWLLK